MNKAGQSKAKATRIFDLIFDNIKLKFIFLDEVKFRRESIDEIALMLENALSEQTITEESTSDISEEIVNKILTNRLVKAMFNKGFIACELGFRLSTIAIIACELDYLVSLNPLILEVE